MQRRIFLRNTTLTTGGFLLMQKQLLASVFQQPAFKITMLTDDIGMFTERGGTILFYLSNDGIVVVDSQFPDTSPHLIEELKKKSDKPFKLLINTHHHGDHSGGNIAFKGITEHVLAHANSKANMERVAQQQNNADKQLFPDRTYTDLWCEKLGKEQICLYYFGAAHTNGDSVVHFTRANIAHMGDLHFNRRHPFVDRSAGANIKSWINVLDKTLKKCDKKTKYVFGHAETGYEVSGSPEDLKLFGEYLENVLKFTEAEIKSGKSKEDILKTTTTPFTSEWKGQGIQRTLQAAYEELTSA
jgi:glyoxylase-like metal-dependent hydrolase (beta-lactamase superfamily II)